MERLRRSGEDIMIGMYPTKAWCLPNVSLFGTTKLSLRDSLITQN